MYLKHRWNIDFGVDEVSQVVSGTTDLIVFAITSGASGVGINKVVNPGNAASSHLAVMEKREVQDIKDLGK